ncbi:MAG: hypothetical protein R3321_13660 [Nitrososphaeraceae archaeon]|nr:hypothetical protein [Nitrososphaeraceae archaeon]
MKQILKTASKRSEVRRDYAEEIKKYLAEINKNRKIKNIKIRYEQNEIDRFFIISVYGKKNTYYSSCIILGYDDLAFFNARIDLTSELRKISGVLKL